MANEVVHVLSVWRDVELVGYLVGGTGEVPYPPTEEGLQRAFAHAAELRSKYVAPNPTNSNPPKSKAGKAQPTRPVRSRARSRSLWTGRYGGKT